MEAFNVPSKMNLGVAQNCSTVVVRDCHRLKEVYWPWCSRFRLLKVQIRGPRISNSRFIAARPIVEAYHYPRFLHAEGNCVAWIESCSEVPPRRNGVSCGLCYTVYVYLSYKTCNFQAIFLFLIFPFFPPELIHQHRFEQILHLNNFLLQ